MSSQEQSPNGTYRRISEIAPPSANSKISDLKGKQLLLTQFAITGSNVGMVATLVFKETENNQVHIVKTNSKVILEQLGQIESNDRLPLLCTPVPVGRTYGLR